MTNDPQQMSRPATIGELYEQRQYLNERIDREVKWAIERAKDEVFETTLKWVGGSVLVAAAVSVVLCLGHMLWK